MTVPEEVNALTLPVALLLSQTFPVPSMAMLFGTFNVALLPYAVPTEPEVSSVMVSLPEFATQTLPF